MPALTVLQACSLDELTQARTPFEEYAVGLGFSLCFQGFDAELAGLPGDYTPPRGRLLLARVGTQLAGCVALHPFGEDCEMKRLYVRPDLRGHGAGAALARAVIAEAAAVGYPRMLLDTVSERMPEAVVLYRGLGFRETTPYRPNPIPGALYMELALARPAPRPRDTPAIHVLVFDGHADWEIGLALAEVRRSGGLPVVTLGFGPGAVCSMGGLVVTPQLALSEVAPESVRLLVLPGGDMWEREAYARTAQEALIPPLVQQLGGAGLAPACGHDGGRDSAAPLAPQAGAGYRAGVPAGQRGGARGPPEAPIGPRSA